MANPDNCKNNTGHPNSLTRHKNKSDCHQQRHAGQYRHLGSNGHTFFLNERLQMFMVHFCVCKPIVKFLRALRKAKHGRQEKRNSWQNRKNNTYAAQAKTDTADHKKNQALQSHLYLLYNKFFRSQSF